MDTLELYRENLSKNRILLEKNNWIDNPFTYSFNSNGFRCDEFTSDSTILFLGCSFTCGIGLPIDTIWPELVAKQLNMQCANLGQGGGSADTAFRLCHGWIDQIKPKVVVFLQPPGIRWELITNDQIKLLIAGSELKFADEYTKNWVIDDNNHYFNTTKNVLAIESMCNFRQIKFLKFNSLPCIDDDRARDLVHSGRKTHRLFADQVIAELSK